jgi:hypothetical protein
VSLSYWALCAHEYWRKNKGLGWSLEQATCFPASSLASSKGRTPLASLPKAASGKRELVFINIINAQEMSQRSPNTVWISTSLIQLWLPDSNSRNVILLEILYCTNIKTFTKNIILDHMYPYLSFNIYRHHPALLSS